MLAIKLSPKGKTNKKMFRLIISEKGRDPYGNVLETLGSYNPHSKELIAKAERIQYWISKGAQMTASVNNLLVQNKIVEGEKVTASKPGEKSEKRAAQIKAKADKKTARESAEKEVKEAPVKEEKVEEAPAEEAVVEEVPTEEQAV